MYAAVIAVIGTLAGALVSGLLQHRIARSQHESALADQLRTEKVDALTALGAAVADHRLAMWKRTDALFCDAEPERLEALRDASHETRSAISGPDTRVRLLIRNDVVREAATEAIETTYAMRDAAAPEDLQTLRRRAVEGHDALLTVAGRYLS